MMFIPQKPRPSDEEKDGRLIATMTDKVPAPEYSIERSEHVPVKDLLR